MSGQPLVVSYSLSGATGEILVMLLIAFALGAFLGWFVARTERDARLRMGRKRLSEAFKDRQLQLTGTQIAIPLDSEHTDNLRIIAGISPEIEKTLHTHGIRTFKDLSRVTVARIESVLKENGTRPPNSVFSWPEQAKLLIDSNHK